MKSFTRYLTMHVDAERGFVNITPEVEAAVRESGVREGLVLVNPMHITASVFINDNERGLHHDFEKWLEELAPFNPSPEVYHHNRTGEINADAHLNRPGPAEWLYTSLGGLVWMYVALFFPFAHKSVETTWAHVDPALLDEGALLGAGAWAQFRSAVWPVARPRAVIGGMLVALLAAREVDATGLLRIPGGDTIAFRIQDYLHYAPGPNVAALCVLLVALSATVTAALSAWALWE